MRFKEASPTRKSRRIPDDFSDSELFANTHIGVTSTSGNDAENDIVRRDWSDENQMR